MWLYGSSKQCFKKVVFKMARKSTVIDQVIFTKSVKEAEKNGALKNLSELYDAIASAYTLAVIALGSTTFCSPTLAKKHIEDWGIETLTSPGKKGRPAKESFLSAKLVKLNEACTVILETIPEEYQHLIASLIEIIDEKETTTETAEIEDETLQPIMPEQTGQMIVYGQNEGWNLAA